MPLAYTPEQRLPIVKLRHKYDTEAYANIMDRYNNLAVSQTHLMSQAREVKRIIQKLKTTFTLLDAKSSPGQTKTRTKEN